MTVWTPHKPIFETKRFPRKIGLWKLRDWAQIALFGSLGTLCLTSAGPSGADGTKYGPLGPSEDLGGPQKGLLGPNRA